MYLHWLPDRISTLIIQQLSQKINLLGKRYPGLCNVRSLAKTAGGKDIWLVTIGTGDSDNKPAVAILEVSRAITSLAGNSPLGVADNILKNSGVREIKDLLDKITFYILPDVSPDATGTILRRVKYERKIQYQVN